MYNSRRKRRTGLLNEIWWDNENNKKFYAYVALIICIIIGIILGGYQLNSYLKKRQIEEKEFSLEHAGHNDGWLAECRICFLR